MIFKKNHVLAPVYNKNFILSVSEHIKKTIGWHEKIDLPELDIYGIDAKVDTGAKSSVLHCSKIEIITKKQKQFVKFIPLDDSYPLFSGKEFVLPCHKEKTVKSSFGQEEQRLLVYVTIRIFKEEFKIELALRDRSIMEFPMLLGRTTLRKRFIVDVSRSNLSDKSLLKKKSIIKNP